MSCRGTCPFILRVTVVDVIVTPSMFLICSSFSSVPFITRKKKVPKVKMLRLAIKYIQHLESILNGGYVVSKGIDGVRSIQSIG